MNLRQPFQHVQPQQHLPVRFIRTVRRVQDNFTKELTYEKAILGLLAVAQSTKGGPHRLHHASTRMGVPSAAHAH